ncbi:MAG: quaternary ammonium transporter [Cyanobacteria bacterium QS_8_64_29]|nr:MAG: quaternary ammonium transporter [Cyanobacteria bacterium QS_8_64_29]
MLAVAVALVAVACGSGSETAREPIRIGSKDFAEQRILGEAYAQLLDANGYAVEREFNLGGTPVAHAALTSGEIDCYPEYTGTALLTVLEGEPSADREAVYRRVAQAYRQRYDLRWLQPSPMSNSQALVTTTATARQYGLETVSDFAARASELILAGPPEFRARADGLPGLKQAYGNFELAAYKAVDPGLRYRALLAGEADAVVGFTTDGEIAARDLVVLADDRNLFPPYQVAPVVRAQLLAQRRGLQATLNKLAPHITTERMRQLNYRVTGKQQEPAAVARSLLTEAYLLPAP